MHPLSRDLLRDPLMLIRAGGGREVPIVCLPGAGASVTTFLPFAEALGAKWPVYGLQPRGIDASEPPDASVEEAALGGILALARLAAAKRLHLIGHSHGGVIAFEIARRLEQLRGGCVASLTVIDSDLSAVGNAERFTDDASIFREFVEGLEKTFRVSLRLNRPDIFTTSDSRRFLREVHGALVKSGCWPPSSAADMLSGPLATFVASCRCAYEPASRYGGKVALALASETTERANPHAGVSAEAWERHSNALEAWRCPGNHFSMLQAPHVQKLAAWWRNARESEASEAQAESRAATGSL